MELNSLENFYCKLPNIKFQRNPKNSIGNKTERQMSFLSPGIAWSWLLNLVYSVWVSQLILPRSYYYQVLRISCVIITEIQSQ
jgi:hypothetical protein